MAAVSSIASPQEAAFEGLNVARDKNVSATEASQNRFLTLLTTQLRNQDPLNPMDNAQLTSQLAQISTVDGIERLNQTLQTLMDNSVDTQALQAATLVGRSVLVPGSEMHLDEGRAFGGVELARPADRVTVTVRDANGLTVRTLDLGARAVGSTLFAWDGTTDNGTPAAPGRYTLAVEAVQGGERVSASALQVSQVNSVVREGGALTLSLSGGHAATMSQVKQIL